MNEMNEENVTRDERTIAVENATFRVGYLLTAFGVLLDVVYRAGALHQSCWDLLGLLVAGGLVMLIMQGKERILCRGFGRILAFAIALGITFGIVTALMKMLLRH